MALPAHAQWQTHPAPRPVFPMWYGVDVAAFAILDAATPSGRLLFAAGAANGRPDLYRSSDDGLTWHVNAIAGYPNPTVYWAGTTPTPQGVPSRRGDLYVTIVVGGGFTENNRCDLLRSGDEGATWTAVARNVDACVIVFDPSSPLVAYGIGVGYSAVFYPAVYRSVDGGASWLGIGQHLRYATSQLNAAADGTLYALAGGVYVSRDQGETWTAPASWPAPSHPSEGDIQANDLVTWRHPLHGDSFAVIATSNGLYKTIDAGANWLPAGLQGFWIDRLDLVDDPASVELQVLIGYRRGLALLRGEAIFSLTNGLPAGIDPEPMGGRYVASPAGLSICADLQSCIGGTLPHTATLIEYHNAALDHYFMTLAGGEADGIDRGAAGPGWSRTGVTFEVLPDITATGYQYRPVCRFYGTPGIGPNSHFYTIDYQECANVRADPGWTLESTSAFVARPPERGCGAGRVVYRLYNNRFAQNDSNHRYVADLALYQSLQAQGWKGEGAQLCVLR
ncbi:MAG: exo-alpha-sialidase [Betaproteobacteria bacterium]|nr:exo-alpha-sialidase [Betaproteobacteria bacterium]